MEKNQMDERKEAVFRSRKGYTLYKMMGGNSIWVRKDTKTICNLILDFLEKDFQEQKKARKVTLNQIHEATKIRRGSISTACYLLAFSEKPFIRIWGEKSTPQDRKVRVWMRVKLLPQGQSKPTV